MKLRVCEVLIGLLDVRRRLPLVGCVVALGCASELERASQAGLARTSARLNAAEGGARPGRPAARFDGAQFDGARFDGARFDGKLSSYVAHAFALSPSLRSSFEQWRAAASKPAQERKLSEPAISYAAFVRHVETRVGPQQHRLGIRWMFPWPSKLTAGGRAAAYGALAQQRRFEAHALTLAAQVAHAYWKLWRARRSKQVRKRQHAVLLALADQVRARIAAGTASLADLAQVDLSISRSDDSVAGLAETIRAASAALIRRVGAPPASETPTELQPPWGVGNLPADDIEALRSFAWAHPRVGALSLLSKSSDQRVLRARASRYPTIGVGVDWMITGQALNRELDDSGKDAVMAMVSLSLPLWTSAYSAAEAQARAEGAAFAAQAQALRDQATAELETVMSRLRDAARRARLYRSTLIPQAETTYRSVLDGYANSRSTLAAILLAERELLELQIGLIGAQADWAAGWASLEHVVGRPVAPQQGGEQAVSDRQAVSDQQRTGGW
ncbi:MAG: TolC family protein [Proteobacteria bacterium]|nr:TolC family protein [Pseudomonadota bacterium]